MNITSIDGLTGYSQNGLSSATTASKGKTTFDDLFQAAVNMVKDTNNYTKAAKEQETAYALGLNDSQQDLLVAQQKANLSLQYTVAIRNHVLDAYKEIMNLQF